MIPDSPQWTARGRARLEQHAAALLKLRLREPHPTRIERVEVGFLVELRDGTQIRITESAWC